MESFRTLIRGWLGKVLLVLFLTPFALVGIEGYFSQSKNADVAKTVNGQDISNKEVDELVKKYKQQYLNAVNGDETLLNTAFIRQNTIDSLVARTVLSQQAEKLGIALSNTQLEKMIAQQPSFQENGKFSNALYENYLRSVSMTNADLLKSLREDHALKMLVSALSNTALVGQNDIQQISQFQSEQRQLHLASIKLDAFKAKQTVTEQQLLNYYNAHKDQFNQVAKVDVDFVLLTPTQVLKADSPVTNTELQQAYSEFVKAQATKSERQVKHILITADGRSDADAKKLADEVYLKIKAGMRFADAAKQYSDDTSSKNAGGVLEAYQKGVFSKEFDNAVTALAANEISKPVKTQYGYHIIEANAVVSVVPSLEQETVRLTAEIQKNKAANAYADTVNRLNDEVVNSDSLQPITEEVKATQVESVNGVSFNTDHPYLSDSNVKARIFGEDVKSGDRNVSSSIQLANGDTIWIKVRRYQAAGIPAFSAVKAQVRAKVIEQKAYEAAQSSLNAMLKAFTTQPAAAVVSKYGYSFENAGTFTRSQGLKREIERAAFSLKTPKAGMWSATTTHLPNELVVVAVSQVNANATVVTAEQRVQLSKLYAQMRGQQELQDYTEYLKQHAKIK